MDDLLGLFALTIPLWFFLILLSGSIWVAVKLSKLFKRRGLAGIGIFLIIFLAPISDEIAGKLYLSHLCSLTTGYKIHNTIQLSAEHWDDQGNPMFYNQRGGLKGDFFRSHLKISNSSTKHVSSVLMIDKGIDRISDISSNRVVGEIATYRFWGGWVRRNLLIGQNIADTCDRGPGFRHEFYSKIFIKAKSANEDTKL